MPRMSEVAQRDFSGGVNAVTNPYLVGDRQSVRIRNLILDEHGALTTRDGYSIVTADPSVTGPVVLRGVLTKTDGSFFGYAATLNVNPDGTIDSTIVWNTNTTPWTVALAIANDQGVLSPIPQSVTMNNTEVFATGYAIPATWDGVTGSNLHADAGQTVPPGAQHLAFHQGSLWVFNTAPNTTTLDGPSSLRMSDANNFYSWPNSTQIFISKDDGQVGMGLATFTIVETGISPTQTLVAFKNYSAYQVTGVLTSPLNFSVQKIKSDMGCIAPRTIQFVSGFGIIRLTHKGFALFDGVNDRLISEEIRPFLFGQDDITPIYFAGANRAYASQSQNPPLYIAACPVGSVALTRFFIYDLVRKAWTIADYPVDFQCLNLFTSPAQQPVVQGGSATGTTQIRALFNGDTTDNGVPIDWSFRTKKYFLGSWMRPTYWRRLVIDAAVNPPQDMDVSVTLTGINETFERDMRFTGEASGSRWGTAIWGQFRWAGSGLVEGQRSVSFLRVAPSAQADVGGTGYVKIRGLAWHAVPWPLNRQHL